MDDEFESMDLDIEPEPLDLDMEPEPEIGEMPPALDQMSEYMEQSAPGGRRPGADGL